MHDRCLADQAGRRVRPIPAQAQGGVMGNASEKLNAHIAQIGAEAARLQAQSGEYLWVCRHEKPPLLPDPEPEKTETNPLRRTEGVAPTRVRTFSETRLDYSAARPPTNQRKD
jgi:hypothetical protein